MDEQPVATQEFLLSEIQKKNDRITELEEHIQRVTQRDFETAAKLNGLREDMQKWTLDAIEHGTIDESTAEEIADVVGFELTTEFELEVSVQYSVTVNARNEEEAMNAIYDIDFDSVSYNDDSITYLSSSVDRVDI